MEWWHVIIWSAVVSLAYSAGWVRGRKAGIREGFDKFVHQLRFERRHLEPLEPTGQPHSRRPKGNARVTDAHMSQVRRYWTD